MKTELTKLVEEREERFNKDFVLFPDPEFGDIVDGFKKEEMNAHNRQTSIELIEGIVEGVETMKYDNPNDNIMIGAINAILKDVQSMLQKSLDELKLVK